MSGKVKATVLLLGQRWNRIQTLIKPTVLTMVLTQESIVSLLIAEGGKVKKSDLLEKFKGLIDCVDPAEKARNRELFKTWVNNVAVVKEIDGVRYVVIKKTYQPLLGTVQTAESRVEKSGNEEILLTGEQQRPPVRSEKRPRAQEEGDVLRWIKNWQVKVGKIPLSYFLL